MVQVSDMLGLVCVCLSVLFLQKRDERKARLRQLSTGTITEQSEDQVDDDVDSKVDISIDRISVH